MSVVEEAYTKSIALLEALVTPYGFVATNIDSANYKRVWARDGVVSGIAALHTGNTKLIETFKHTLKTLAEYQDETGRIPSNVDPEQKKVSYGTSVGRIDATIWFVLGVALCGTHDHVSSELVEAAEKAVRYLSCLELNGRGFLYIPHGGDWADEYINHGYVLFDEALYALALIHFGRMTKNIEVENRGLRVRDMIGINFLPNARNLEHPLVYHKPVFQWSADRWRGPFPIAYFTNHSIGLHLDFWGSALFGLLECGDEYERNRFQEAMYSEVVRTKCTVVPAFDPVITKKDTHHWEQLQKNFLFDFKNQPYHFHNGGRWPVVHGFVLTSIKGNHEHLVEKFAQVLKDTKYTFPEYLHGDACTPGGMQGLGFSASGYILAYASNIIDKNFLSI